MRTLMRRAAIVALIALCGCRLLRGPESIRPPTGQPGTAEQSVRIGVSGEVRTYVLHVPPDQPRRFGIAQRFPLLILMHGSSADGNEIREETKMDSIADANRFVAAYPNGSTTLLGRQSSDWNAGVCCGNAASRDVDDIGLLRAIIDEVAQRLPIDTLRIYIAGFSDGGRMAYRAACELSNQIAAVGVVSGSLKDPDCHPAVPVSLIAFHGTADHEVPYDDSLPSVHWPSTIPAASAAPPSVRFWASQDACRGFTLRRVSAVVTRGVFTGCRGTEVVLYTIEGGVHGWVKDVDPEPSRPEQMHALNTSAILVRFLLSHSR